MIINNESLKRVILTALSDNEMIKILDSTKNESKSAVDIMKMHDITHSTVYRKTKWLLDNGLLVVDKIEIKEDGKKFSLLKSTIRSVSVNYENSDVIIDIKENETKLRLSAKQFFSIE